MIEQPDRLPLAQYLRLFELAQDLDAKTIEGISIETVEEEIKRQLESILPVSHARVGFKPYADLEKEEEAISRILRVLEREIRPVAARLSSGFVERLQEEYEEAWHTVQNKLKQSDELDREYRQIQEQEQHALTKKQETLSEAHQRGVGLQSVTDLAHEIRGLEEAQEGIRLFHQRSADEWAVLAEQQIDREKAKEFWQKAVEQDDGPILRDRRDKHLAVLKVLEEEASCSYDELLKEAKELFERATRAPIESLSKPDNDLRRASEKCRYIVEALAEHSYPSTTSREAARLVARIGDFNDRMWHSHAIAGIAQAEVHLAGDDLHQANDCLAQAQITSALVWDSELRGSLTEKLDIVRKRIESEARQRTDHIINQWSQQAQSYLENGDAMAALNCIYAAKGLAFDAGPEGESFQELEALENKALATFSKEGSLEASSLAERASQFLSQGDSQSAFRWLQAALRLDARAILSELTFSELTDAFFEFQSKRQRVESLLVQANFRLEQDPRDPDNLLAADGLLAEADRLLDQLGESGRFQEVAETRSALRQRHGEALIEELDALLQKLEEVWRTQEPPSQQTRAVLSKLQDLSRVLARMEKARISVKDIRPHLQQACDYYAKLTSDNEVVSDLNSVEGYSLSYMLLSKISTWEAG